jgi:hypothetical protein
VLGEGLARLRGEAARALVHRRIQSNGLSL